MKSNSTWVISVIIFSIALVCASLQNQKLKERQYQLERSQQAYQLLVESLNVKEVQVCTLEQTNLELIKNLRLIPSVPVMKAALNDKSSDLAEILAIERQKLPLGVPFEKADYIITSYFGDRVFNHVTQVHRGIDLIPKTRNPYERIVATEAGIIKKIGLSPIYGKFILIDHGNGYLTFYAHLRTIYWQNRETKKVVGEHVDRGTVIGIIGATGVATGVHLHYEVRYNNGLETVVVNPQTLLEIQR